MPDQPGSDEPQFVEIEGVKFKADPDNPKEALKDEQDQAIPFEEKPKKEKEEPPKDELKEEPPVRRSAKDFIIARKEIKIKKLEKEKEKDEEGDEFTPEGKELIQKRIERAVKPVLDQVRGQSDEQELKDVLNKYGEPAEKLRKKIEKYMNHPAYQNVPVEFIFLGLASDVIKKAEKKKAADEEAEKDTTGGDQKRPKTIAKIPDVTAMDDEEFGKLVHKVRTGQF